MDVIKDMNKTAGDDFGRAFIEEVRERLVKCRGEWNQIIALSNGSLSRPWLASFSQGRIDAPSLTLISELGMYLGLRLTVKKCRNFSEVKVAYRP